MLSLPQDVLQSMQKCEKKLIENIQSIQENQIDRPMQKKLIVEQTWMELWSMRKQYGNEDIFTEEASISATC